MNSEKQLAKYKVFLGKIRKVPSEEIELELYCPCLYPHIFHSSYFYLVRPAHGIKAKLS